MRSIARIPGSGDLSYSTSSRDARPTRRRAGLTLTELLVATTIMIMIAGAMGTLTMTVHSTNNHCRGQALAAQHGRVALQRIEQAIAKSFANERFPGFIVLPERAGSFDLPDTLVVWIPVPPPAESQRHAAIPMIADLKIFAPDPTGPHRLLEITAPQESGAAPALNQTSEWKTLVDRLKTSGTTQRVVLTDRLRSVPLSGSIDSEASPADLRGALRFRVLMKPDAAEWAEYRNNNRAWDALNWPLNSYRSTSGTRRVVCQTELQIVPGDMDAAPSTAVPLFGSVSISYELTKVAP
jgi:hypothetical protein